MFKAPEYCSRWQHTSCCPPLGSLVITRGMLVGIDIKNISYKAPTNPKTYYNISENHRIDTHLYFKQSSLLSSGGCKTRFTSSSKISGLRKLK